MALLFVDGFDHSGATNTIHFTKYSDGSGAGISTSSPRTGLGRLNLGNSFGYVTTKPLTASGGCVVGCAIRVDVDDATADSGPILHVREGGTTHLRLEFTTSRTLRVVRGDGTVLATGTTVLPLGTWVYVELKTVIHDSAGTYAVRLDGVAEAALTGSGADTRNGGTGVWDRIHLIGIGGGGFQFSLDDLYVCDTSGAAPQNDFLGPCQVETLLPQTGNGSNAGLTPSTGTDHGALVDENPPNTSDYNSSATVGAKDTYTLPSLALTGAILGIQTNLYAAKSDAAARQVCAVVRTGGTDYDGANVAPTTTFSYYSEPRPVNPQTGLAWTTADIDALEVGMKVTV